MKQKKRLGLRKFIYITAYIIGASCAIGAVQYHSYYDLALGVLWIIIGTRGYKVYKRAKSEADQEEREAERARRAYLLYDEDEEPK